MRLILEYVLNFLCKEWFTVNKKLLAKIECFQYKI
jgi:hypothetical protein